MDRQNTLEKAAIRVMVAFQPQEIANILHIMATKKYKTCLLPELERRAEAISGEFNSQQLAKTRLIFDTFILVFYLQIMHVTVDGSAK